jgi:hypothetical protein
VVFYSKGHNDGFPYTHSQEHSKENDRTRTQLGVDADAGKEEEKKHLTQAAGDPYW